MTRDTDNRVGTDYKSGGWAKQGTAMGESWNNYKRMTIFFKVQDFIIRDKTARQKICLRPVKLSE